MRRDEVSLEDIRNAAKRAIAYAKGMTRAQFLSDDKTKAAVVREMEIMGEAATRISQGFRDAHPTIPWARLVRFRNFYIHVYDAVNYALVWETLRRLLPTVEAAVTALLPADEGTETD